MTDQDIADLLSALNVPAFAVAPSARIVGANTAARALLGDVIENRHYVAALRQPALIDAVEKSVLESRHVEAVYTRSDRVSETRYRVLAAPIGAGASNGILVSFEDISHVHEAGQMRRDFVANVSHELRTPLTALLGVIETLRGPAKDDPKARDHFLATMAREASRMNRLVGDLLTLSRVEANERLRPIDHVDLQQVLSASISSLCPASTGQICRLEMPDNVTEVTLRGDEDQLRQVFNNLIENALKYGGDVSAVTVRIHPPSKVAELRSQAVRIDVIDRGPGFDPIHIPRLAERFYRVDEGRSREKGGTGLGLAIVKHIVNRHRGKLEIATTPGQGSVFSVILPVA